MDSVDQVLRRPKHRLFKELRLCCFLRELRFPRAQLEEDRTELDVDGEMFAAGQAKFRTAVCLSLTLWTHAWTDTQSDPAASVYCQCPLTISAGHPPPHNRSMIFRAPFACPMRVDDFPLHPALLEHDVGAVTARPQHCRGPSSAPPRQRSIADAESAIVVL